MNEIIRKYYLEELFRWKDKRFIKILTGIRRCGKSTILKQFQKELINKHSIAQKQIFNYDFNDKKLASSHTWLTLLDEILKNSSYETINYVFLDEIQEIKEWEKCLITLFENKNKTFDIYITGSNANLLSSEFSTFLTGRHKDIMVYPIEYSELLSFFNFEKYDLLDKYLTYGGLGISIPYYESNKELKRILVDIFNDTIERDIKKRYNAKSNIHIDKVINFAYSTIGGIISTTNLEKFLKNDKKYSLTTKTIEKYLKWICNSQLLFKVNYFDVKGKRVLKTSGKYYAGDLGLLSCKIGFSSSINEGFRMENAVYLHLLNCGYEVYTFKNKNGHEIDFLTIDGENNFSFIQVTSLLSDENYERESRSLLELKNAWPKKIIYRTMNCSIRSDGIEKISIVDFLKGTN